MNMLSLIEAKRDGQAHDPQELAWLVRQVAAGSVPDYQVAAWLMAVVWRGMTPDETLALTLAMAESGEVLRWDDLDRPVVDKHSTGGVGDKTSLVVGPLAAACGLVVAKMSGRGLGHTGGTLDKLESIPGLTVDLDVGRFRRQAREVGLVVAGQSAELAPADGKLYALRDVTGTVGSLPLIAASIMSKKLAAGASSIVLDVKSGIGAFLTSLAEATKLGQAMVDIGQRSGRNVRAVLSAMDQPLGLAVGNALEVEEAIRCLRGEGPADLTALAVEITAQMIDLAQPGSGLEAARQRTRSALGDGRGLERFRQMVVAQGGDGSVVDDCRRLPQAPVRMPVASTASGSVAVIGARLVADACLGLGAGRMKKGDAIDHAVGVVLRAKCGDPVAVGDELAVVHARSEDQAREAAAKIGAAFRTVEGPAPHQPLILGVLGASGSNGRGLGVQVAPD